MPSTLADAIVDGGGDGGGPPVPPSGSVSVPLGFSVAPVFCCNPLSLEFNVDVAVTGGVTYAWDFDDFHTATGPSVEHTFAFPGQYTVVLTANGLGDGEAMTALIVSLTVNDDGGTELVVTPPPSDGPVGGIPPASTGPVALAGPNRVVDAGDSVTLDGSGSYATAGGVLTYAWSQVGGPVVELDDDDEAVASFTAPDIGAGTATLAFELAVTENGVLASDTVVVTVVGTSAGGAPVALPGGVTIASGAPAVLTLNGADGDGDDLTFSIVEAPVHGMLGTLDNSPTTAATVVYTPAAGFLGVDALGFAVTDGVTESSVAAFTIIVLDGGMPLQAVDVSYVCHVDTPALISLTGNDAGGDDLTFAIANNPTHGSITPVSPTSSDAATVVYTPQAGFEGTDTFSFTVSNGLATSSAAEVTVIVMKAILPWIEVNTPLLPAAEQYTPEQGAAPGMTVLDYALVGMERWAEVTDQALVTTTVGQVNNVYPELMQRIPATMRVFGGVKPLNLPGVAPYDPATYDFADAEGWALLAELAQDVVEMTGTNVFLLENETPLEPFHTGLASIDFDELAVSLVPLRDTGITVWWNLPTILADSANMPNRRALTAAFVAAVADAVPNSVFMTGFTMWHDWAQNAQGEIDRREQMIDLVGLARMQERLIVTPDGYWHAPSGDMTRGYTVAESLSAIPGMAVGPINVFPGAAQWNLVAQAYADALPPLAPPP
ncbi:MAG: Ig-like domain-containing protein [Phycisphaerae bacterium]